MEGVEVTELVVLLMATENLFPTWSKLKQHKFLSEKQWKGMFETALYNVAGLVSCFVLYNSKLA